MDNEQSAITNEEHPVDVAPPPPATDPVVTEENEQVHPDEMPSHVEEILSSIPSSAPSTPKMEKPNKITVVLCAVGGAPIMKQRKWEVDSNQTVGFISSFIRKKLALQKSDSLFFYVNQSFAPSLDQSVQNLFDCFGSDGKLILAYCKTHAWG